MRAALIYNPESGRGRGRRQRVIESCVQLLREAGHEAMPVPTHGPGSATEQARAAIHRGHDMIFACGGDGTVNEVLQSLVATKTTATLGVVPMGTGNVLATELGLPMNPVAAVRKQLGFAPRSIACGKVEFTNGGARGSRYFIATLGLGQDAEMLYRATVHAKGRFGMGAYFFEGLRLTLAGDERPFKARYMEADGRTHTATVSQVLVMRVAKLGPMFGQVAPGASLLRNDVQLVLFRTSRFIDYARYVAGAITRLHWKVGGIDLAHAIELECEPLPEAPLKLKKHVEADGEPLGTLPARVTVVPDAVKLLMQPAVQT